MLFSPLQLTQCGIHSFKTVIREDEISVRILEFQMRKHEKTLSLCSLCNSSLEGARVFSKDGNDLSKGKEKLID